MAHIQIGYFRDFLEDPEVLLVDADADGLQALAEFGTALSHGQPASIHTSVSFHHCPPVAFELSARDEGLTKAESGWACRWSPEQWASIADNVRGMVEHASACHQYVDSDNDGATVIISTGEYGPAWWGWETAI